MVRMIMSESAPTSAYTLFDPAQLENRRILRQEAGLALPPGPGGYIFAIVLSIIIAQIMMRIGFIGINELYEGFIENNLGKILAAGGLVGTVLAFLFTVKLFK